MNTMSAEHVYGLNKFEAETAYLYVVSQLNLEGEDVDEIDTIANNIMDNSKHYPEYFTHSFFRKVN